MNLKEIRNVYFVGIGGIGMSALARWFARQGRNVAGYDKVETPLTQALVTEGISVNYQDDTAIIDQATYGNTGNTLVVYTPAIPAEHKQLNHFRANGFTIKKRAEVLGIITKGSFTIGIAGTHGKTTTSSMVAHILHHSGHGCNAFIGGIMTNYQSNLILGKEDDVVVVEADEFDRSFLHLHPNVAVITSVDPDHLDIYGDHTEMRKTFNQYASRTDSEGLLLLHHQVASHIGESQNGATRKTYGIDNKEITVKNLRVGNGNFIFDYVSDDQVIEAINLQVPGFHNMENCTAAIQVALYLGIAPEKIKEAVAAYQGVQRRFQYLVKTDKLVFIDDYAHHPGEINALISSVRKLYPGKKITAVFQPHLYSRTKDFAEGFAEELSKTDELIMLEIYPAREKPIPGVNSQMILDRVTLESKKLVTKEELPGELKHRQPELLLTIGAGDIDLELPGLVKSLKEGGRKDG